MRPEPALELEHLVQRMKQADPFESAALARQISSIAAAAKGELDATAQRMEPLRRQQEELRTALSPLLQQHDQLDAALEPLRQQKEQLEAILEPMRRQKEQFEALLEPLRQQEDRLRAIFEPLRIQDEQLQMILRPLFEEERVLREWINHFGESTAYKVENEDEDDHETEARRLLGESVRDEAE